MKYDIYGQAYTDSNELTTLLYKNSNLDLSLVMAVDPEEYNQSRRELHLQDVLPELKKYSAIDCTIEEFDSANQQIWRMPAEYIELDIAKWVLDQCKQEHEFQRVGQELLLFQERDLFNLLRYLKYLVDTFRKHNIVWGVGRGSSVASYVLFLIGIHKINSIYYDLNIEEFLK